MLKTHELYNLILDHLEQKKPFSNLRVGDGEAKFLHFPKNSKQSIYIQKKQINREINELEFEDIIKKLSLAICKADVLGIPNTIESKKSDWVYVLPVLEELKKKTEWSCEKYCNMWSNRHLLEMGLIDNILKKIKEIVIISGRDVGEKIKEKYNNIERIEYHTIPPEQNYEKVKNTTVNTLDLFSEISKKIQDKNREGQLLLYGTGFFGKYLGQVFKESGGVSIDMGSVFDIFAGLSNRGWSINLVKKYKL